MKIRKFSAWDVLIYAFCLIFGFCCLFPFYYVFIISLADPIVVLKKPFYVLPYSVDFSSYKMLFSEGSLVSSALVSIFTTVVGTVLGMLFMVMCGYALSKKHLPGRRFFMTFALIPMFIGAQTIPYYVLIRSLGMMNTVWVLIVPTLISSYYLIIIKNFFLSVPASLEESARIDGANDYLILFRIIIPTSMPMLISVTLFMAVAHWNEWWHAMLFITNRKLWPMQMMLRDMLANITNNASTPLGQMMMSSRQTMSPENVRMAAVMITCLPILLIYPFVQKHLVKGMMIGAIKE